LIQLLTKSPERTFLIAMDDDIAPEQRAQLMPIWTMAAKIQEMKDSEGNPLFPHLKTVRGSGKKGSLMKGINDMLGDKEIDLAKENIILIARKINIYNDLFKNLEGISWITGIDDSRVGNDVYVPVFESITLTIMAMLESDIESIKLFYDRIAQGPIEPITKRDLEMMIENRLIYILPKIGRMDPDELREMYKLAKKVYLAV